MGTICTKWLSGVYIRSLQNLCESRLEGRNKVGGRYTQTEVISFVTAEPPYAIPFILMPGEPSNHFSRGVERPCSFLHHFIVCVASRQSSQTPILCESALAPLRSQCSPSIPESNFNSAMNGRVYTDREPSTRLFKWQIRLLQNQR